MQKMTIQLSLILPNLLQEEVKVISYGVYLEVSDQYNPCSEAPTELVRQITHAYLDIKINVTIYALLGLDMLRLLVRRYMF